MPAPGVESQGRLSSLRQFEGELRRRFAPLDQAPALDSGGADPYRIVKLPGRPGYVGLLRGAKALVELDADLAELVRVPLPEAPSALCLSTAAEAWVGSRYSPLITRVRLGAAAAPESETWTLKAHGIADLACGETGLVYALEADGPLLLTLGPLANVVDERVVGRGGLRLLRRGRRLLISSLFERSLSVLTLDDRGIPSREWGTIRHDGPIWAFDVVEEPGGLLVALTGVEDRPLIRAHGEFENIDSFLWLYRFRQSAAGLRDPQPAERVASLNVGEHGLLVPKAVQVRAEADGVQVTALASGSAGLLRAKWLTDFTSAPVVSSVPTLPGASDAAFVGEEVIFAAPLFDAWIRLDAVGTQVVSVDAATRPEPAARLGEALFFTDLMAPYNSSTGTHSRFTCETCHFEGGVDGRVHHTGRGDVRVATKPLFGLANNRPHFSRALDPDLSAVSHHEFRVAGAGSGKDPWFALSVEGFPWLRQLGILESTLTPEQLRQALLVFLYRNSHAPNPRARGSAKFSELQSRGARAFQDRCASCHAPRLFSDDPSSQVPYERWESLVFARNAPIVWARGDYEKSGVLPYVHERGTRIPSLRRLQRRPRYFTNGSSATLSDVLSRFRYTKESALHDVAPTDTQLAPLDASTRAALLAFLALL